MRGINLKIYENLFSKFKSFLPPSLREWLRWKRILAKCKNFDRAQLEAAFQVICAQHDMDRIEELHERFRPIYELDPVGATKYLDYNYWLRINIISAVRLGLHKATPQKVLDLGCGPGYFLAVCRHFGHEALGLDAPPEFMQDVEAEVYSSLFNVLKCHKFNGLIKSFIPLNLEGKFDYITGFLVCFNNHRREDEWSQAEWKFFVEDALKYLVNGGILWLELNTNSDRYPELIYYDRDTLKYFKSKGEVNGNIIKIVKHDIPI